MKSVLAAGLLVLAAFSSAIAGPLEPAHVAADAKWLIHVDFDAIRESALLQELQSSETGQMERLLELVTFLQDRYGIDARTNLHGATAYSSTFEPNSGVIVLRAVFDPEKVVSVAKGGTDYSATQHGDHTLHSWTTDEGQKMTAALLGTDTAVIGRTSEQVTGALDLLGGTGQGIGSEESYLVQDAGKGNFFQGAAIDLSSTAERARELPMLQQMERMKVQLSESGTEMVFASAIDAKSKEAAEQFKQLLQGFQGMAVTMAAQAKGAPNIAESIKVDAKESTVNIDWKRSIEDVMAFLKAAHERRANRN